MTEYFNWPSDIRVLRYVRVIVCMMIRVERLQQLNVCVSYAISSELPNLAKHKGAQLDARWQWNRWLERRFGLLELKWNPRRLPRAKA